MDQPPYLTFRVFAPPHMRGLSKREFTACHNEFPAPALKAHWRKAAARTISGLYEDPLRRIGRVVEAFSPQQCRNFLRHTGSNVTAIRSELPYSFAESPSGLSNLYLPGRVGGTPIGVYTARWPDAQPLLR